MGILTEYDEAETMELFKEEAREEGRKEGRAEGIAKGREEGREEAREELIGIYTELKSTGRDADAERFMTDAAYRKQVLEERAAMMI